MKNRLLGIILPLLVCGLAVFLLNPVKNVSAQNETVTISSVSGTTTGFTVAGVTSASAIMIQVRDASNNIISMQTAAVVNDVFTATCTGSFPSGATYSVRVADYEGGTWAATSAAITATPTPTPVPYSDPVYVEPTATPTPEPTAAPTPIPTEIPAPKPLEVGDELTSIGYNANYIITKTGTDDGVVGTLTYTGPIEEKASVTITSKVRINGILYKVTGIAPEAFKGNTTVKKITVGRYVTTIGKSAFSNCTNLKTVIIGKRVKSIGAYAFYNDKALETITIKTKKLTADGIGKKAIYKVNPELVVENPYGKTKKYKALFTDKGMTKGVTFKVDR